MGYHNIAQAKYEALSREYKLADTKPPTEEAMFHAAELLRSYNLKLLYDNILVKLLMSPLRLTFFILSSRRFPCQLQTVSKCCAKKV